MSSAATTGRRRWLGPVDGLRSISHLSLIALHASMLGTAHLPSEGELWDSIRGNWMFSTMQAGGVQVDIFFMLSGFLLADQLLRKRLSNLPTVASTLFLRAMRMLPTMTLVLILGAYIGDVWDPPYTDYDKSSTRMERIASILMFAVNYLDVTQYGSFIGTLMWSCCVDVHVGAVIVGLFRMFGNAFEVEWTRTDGSPATSRSPLQAAVVMRSIFLSLIAVSLSIRGFLFTEGTMNLTKLAGYAHTVSLMTPSSYPWVRDHYQHEWLAPYEFHPEGFEYINSMYLPTHTRFGPFLVGGVLACNLLLAEQAGFQHFNKQQTKAEGVRGLLKWGGYKLLCLVATLASIGIVATPCIPAPPESPLIAQFIVTMALRTLSSVAAATLLFRALVPRSHIWHSGLLRTLLGFPLWKAIAPITFCSYLIHYRLLLEMTFNKQLRGLLGIVVPAITPAEGQSMEELRDQWLQYFLTLFMLGTAVSFVLATALHYGWETRWMRLLPVHGGDSSSGRLSAGVAEKNVSGGGGEASLKGKGSHVTEGPAETTTTAATTATTATITTTGSRSGESDWLDSEGNGLPSKRKIKAAAKAKAKAKGKAKSKHN